MDDWHSVPDGLLLGVAAGGVLSLELIREVAASSSSTAGTGIDGFHGGLR